MLCSIDQQIWITQQWPQDWKKSVFIPIPKKGDAKECSNYHTIALISHASKVVLKILQAGFWRYVNWELPGGQAGFRKGRGTRNQIANIRWIIEKAKELHKNIYTSASWSMLKPLTVWITTNCEKVLESDSESCSVVSDSLWPHGLYSPWNSPGQNPGVSSLSLLQGIFPTQGSNPGLSCCR